MTQWLKSLMSCLCILTVLMHLVPKGKFSMYVRFYGSLLFFLVAAGPLWKLLAGEGELERLLQLEFLKEDYYNLETSISGMSELKNDQIKAAYQKEILRQVQEIADAYGVRTANLRLEFDCENEYRLNGIIFDVLTDGEEQETASAELLKRELAGVFALEPEQIHIRGQGR